MNNMNRQIELERECSTLGAERYRAAVAKAKAQGNEGNLPPQVALTHEIIGKFVEVINEEYFAVERAKGGGRGASVLNFMKQFTPEELAFVTTRCVMDGISGRMKLQKVANEIAGHLLDMLLHEAMGAQAPGLQNYLDNKVRKSNKTHARKVYRLAGTRTEIKVQSLSPSEALRVGTRLVEMMRIAVPDLIKIETVAVASNRTTVVIQATDELLTWIERQHERCELLSPVLLPMVCEPVAWTGPYNGGYLQLNRHKSKLVKTNSSAYLQELANYDLENVYRAVNALQNTRWRINRGVLNAMREVWDMGGNLGGLPRRDLDPIPAKPVDIATNEEARLAWRREAAKTHERNHNLRSKRVQAAQRLWIAEKFVDEDSIWFPWQLDWRGRAYPIPSVIHPQSDDAGRGLLQFAEGKPLGENGAFWLAVHLANCFGVDKVSFDERVKWVHENEEAILDSGLRPIDGQRFWDQADKPWCALAACIEWVGYRMDGESYVSHLPIAMDGSCNGLQNLSAMLLDEVGGKAVNLVPSDNPNDIYAEVARVVAEKAEYMDELKPWKGRINRSLVKRPVMTMPYGSTQVGMRSQLLEVMRKALEDGEVEKLPVDADGQPMMDYYGPCNVMSKVVYDSIGDVVIAAREVMDWLQVAAKVAARNELPIYWVTPLGLPVQQRYMQQKAKEIDFMFGKARFRLTLAEEAVKVDKRKMANGISPNFVHSMDACHMQLTVLYALDNGINSFAMIHDSYGTHAADCDLMFTLLRQAFVDMYSGDVLREFRDGLIKQLPEELAAEIPPLPPKGNLDLNAVMESKYFFA